MSFMMPSSTLGCKKSKISATFLPDRQRQKGLPLKTGAAETDGGDLMASPSTLQFPSLNSQQRLDGARNKVALKPGHSLMDWIRLTHSGKDLTGVDGKLLDVSPEELSKHNTLEDAWISLKGKVYNVTAYMDFHPGGPDELTRGIGKEAISLFNEVHKWVNYESMLEKCLLGKLKSPSNFLLRVIGDSPNPSKFDANDDDTPSYDWFQSDRTVSIVVNSRWKDIKQEHILVDLCERCLRVTMYVQSSTFLFHMELGGEVGDYSVKIGCDNGAVEILLRKAEEENTWPDVGSPLDQHLSFVHSKDREVFYRPCTLRKKSQVTHDIYLFTFELPEKSRMLVPIGQHVFLRARVEDMETTRSYTPVLPSLQSTSTDLVHDSFIHLMVKIYANGAFTPVLHRLQIGETIEIGDYAGNFDVSRLSKCLTIILIAAGTGFTPMVGLIARVLNETDRHLRMLFFNKTEQDIPWRESLDNLSENNSRFLLRHVLSDADESWTGPKGRIRKHLLETFLPPATDDSETLVCICGPSPFTKVAVKYLEELGFSPEDIHAFLG